MAVPLEHGAQTRGQAEMAVPLWKEVRLEHVRIDDVAGAEWFGRGAGQPAGDDGHRNGYLLRDAHSSAAAAAEEAAGDAVDAEGGRQSGHQWRHLWSY